MRKAQLNATSSVPGRFVYNPPSRTVLSVGTHKLNTTFTPTDTVDYNIVSANVLINVTKVIPKITWSKLDNINQGTELGNTQLDATASVPGTFVYNPSSGTVLSAGTHTLNTTFTPTDSTNYTTASASVSINVAKTLTLITEPVNVE